MTPCEAPDCARERESDTRNRRYCSTHRTRLQRYGSFEPRRQPADVRFQSFIKIAMNGCWVWQGVIRNGYGGFWDKGASVLAHRWSYERYIAPIAPGLHVDHLCRVKACVNPAHLEPVTSAENTRRYPLAEQNRTHCPSGHSYEGENLYLAPKTGYRHCRACMRQRQEERTQARRERNGFGRYRH